MCVCVCGGGGVGSEHVIPSAAGFTAAMFSELS